MKRSLSARLSRIILVSIISTSVASVLLLHWFTDEVEDNILNLELKAEADYFRKQIDSAEIRQWQNARQLAIYLPAATENFPLPSYLQNLPTPYTGEIEHDGATHLVRIEAIDQPAGTLLLAQDISIMESRELLTQVLLLIVAGFMLAFALLLSRLGARYLARPLMHLTRDIQGTEPGPSMTRLQTDYRDREFEAIAQAFNRFLSVIEQHIDREKSFVKLASHELRTPLAIISGALEVLHNRNSLSSADKVTVARIEQAARRMQEDTNILLQLARARIREDEQVPVDVTNCIQDVIAELNLSRPAFIDRTSLEAPENEVIVVSEPALVRMLMKNLIQNALLHTQTNVVIRVTANAVSVRDFGPGLPTKVIEKLQDSQRNKLGNLQDSGLGLLIVQLVCERLDWRLTLETEQDRGSHFAIDFSASVA